MHWTIAFLHVVNQITNRINRSISPPDEPRTAPRSASVVKMQPSPPQDQGSPLSFTQTAIDALINPLQTSHSSSQADSALHQQAASHAVPALPKQRGLAPFAAPAIAAPHGPQRQQPHQHDQQQHQQAHECREQQGRRGGLRRRCRRQRQRQQQRQRQRQRTAAGGGKRRGQPPGGGGSGQQQGAGAH